MTSRKLAIYPALLAVGFYMFGFRSHPKHPEIEDGWWGRGERMPDNPRIREFQVNVTDPVLVDLRERIAKFRFQEDLEKNENFHYGFNVATMRHVIVHWTTKFDWRKQEKELNKYPQFVTQIEGIDVHFLHIKAKVSAEVKPKALMMIHGWPGSVWEFYKIIPLLTDPVTYGGKESDAVDIICPSIPGFGFSERPHQIGFDNTDAAVIFVKLMERLGYDKFYVQGGDWGAVISQFIAQMYPSKTIGIHVNVYVPPISRGTLYRMIAASLFPTFYYKNIEYDHFYPARNFILVCLRESGFFHIQSTKPDTIGMGLNDSPVGLAAYILEKFSSWTRLDNRFKPDGGLTDHYTMDELLTNVMIYWVTNTIGSSQRLYREHATSEDAAAWDKFQVDVPAGLLYSPNELFIGPEFLARLRFKHIIQKTDMLEGGHFPAMEQPAVLAKDIQSFMRKVEKK